MVQPNTEARPRRARTRRGEEQAPLVESQLNVPNDVLMEGEEGSGFDHHCADLIAEIRSYSDVAVFLTPSSNLRLVLLQASMARQLSWKPPNWE